MNTDNMNNGASSSPNGGRENKKRPGDSWMISGSIVLAGALVASGIFLGFVYAQKAGQSSPGATGSVTLSPVTDEDHIYGSTKAKVKLVEFSDLDCPFCQLVHPTLKQLVDESDGKVAWVYRHFPLTSLHPSASDKAMVAECVAEVAGNDAFWQFLDSYFSKQDPTAGTELAMSVAEPLGVDTQKLQSCYDSGRYQEKIRRHIEDATAAGANGTPYTVIVSKGSSLPVSGALPIENFRSKIDPLLK